MQKRLRIVIGILMIVGGCISSCLLIRAYGTYSAQKKIRALTTPLSLETTQDLCVKLSLPKTDRRCRADTVVYAPDFYADLNRPFKYGESTYQDVQDLFGQYQYECESRERVAADGYSRFRCSYDFQGDHMFPVIFSFSLENETLVDIMPVLFDSS